MKKTFLTIFGGKKEKKMLGKLFKNKNKKKKCAVRIERCPQYARLHRVPAKVVVKAGP